MALQPKSNNIPECQAEPIVSAAGANPVLVPGSENAVGKEMHQNLKSPSKERRQADAEAATPQREKKTPQKEARPVLGQQQQGKPSRTDNCHCPEIVEEKVKPVCPEDHDKPRQTVTYQRGRFLGKGGFAKCYEVKRIEPIETEEHANTTWALKVVPKANLVRTKARQKLTSEIKIHRSLDHENVVRFDRYFEDKENVYIMLDICSNQSLSDMIKRRKRFHEVETRYYIHQLVSAIQYVHSRKVIHRDLKLGNLFLAEDMTLKVGDFGLAAQVFYQGEKKRTVCGTPNYLAPEVLENGGHSYEVDIWGIGVILYTMLNGRPPFESQEVKQTYKKIKAGAFQFPEHIQIGNYAKDFIRKCLTVDNNKRITLQEMLDHDFLSLVQIPKQMPVSTLVCPPAQAFAKQYSLPLKSSLANDMSPNPMNSNNVRQKRILHHMQTAPMENALRQMKTQKSLEGHPLRADQLKGALYSPLVVNATEGSNNDNAHILGSEKTGATPGQVPTLARQISLGPAFVSEFNPLNEELREKALDNPQVKQAEYNALQKVLVDNFLKTQNVNQLGPQTKMQEMKSQPNSPGGAGSIGRRQINMHGVDASKKSRRLPNSLSATNITQLHRQNSTSTPQANYNSVKPVEDKQINARPATDMAECPQMGIDQTATKQGSAELAKIQPTSAATIDQDLLIQKTDSQPRTELVVKFVDFSSKYGLGYMLSNGSYGVLFNDSTKIILHPNLFHFDYVERSKQQPVLNTTGQALESVTDQVSQFDFFNYPESINKKVVLLQHFKSYLDGNQKFKPLEFNFKQDQAPMRQTQQDNEPLVYIKKWKRAKKAILLRNTNKVIQVMFQDQSELILCSGSGIVTFVNSKQEVKSMPLSVQNDVNLEVTDKSLFKRLQYAKEILVQMMSVASIPPTLALNNQVNEVQENMEANLQNYNTQKSGPTVMRRSTEGSRTAQKGTHGGLAIMSPLQQHRNSKSGQKGPNPVKDYGRTQRILTASKPSQASTNNLLMSCSNAKQQAGRSSSNKFELPMLSNRSNSKPSYSGAGQLQRNQLSQAAGKEVVSNNLRMTQASGSASHNNLPSKIGTGIALAQQKSSTPTTAANRASVGSSQGPSAAPKVSNQKSPGKSFKNVRNAQSAAQMTTLVGSGVRKQQFVSNKM